MELLGQIKRKDERRPTNISAKLRGLNGSSWYESTIVNLSKSGACISCKLSAKPGTTVMMSSRPNGNTYYIPAVVVWVANGQMGIKFLGS